MIESDIAVTDDGRTVPVRDWLAENVHRRKMAEARVAALEQQVEQLRELLGIEQWSPEYEPANVREIAATEVRKTVGLERDEWKSRAEQADQEHARALCEALGERYEPENRDEWRRSFAEMLPLVKARSDAWRTLLTRVEEADPEWLAAWRAGLTEGKHSRHKVERRLVAVDTPLSLAGWPSPTCTCPGPYTKDLDCPVHGDGQRAPCPDGGRCHHECQRGDCFRVRCCGPLSGIYPGDVWPDEVVRSLLR